ncbi:MAG TPA: lysozyme inhibitor LprI family protein [Mesorhizobium sp.]|nr:lysozyme inhibitor LprI family protein [Mesorhizobium sp.]
MLLTLLLTATSLARAEEKRDCANAITQSDMNQCASMDFDEADKELNAIWKTARETARKLDEQQHEGDMKGAEQALLAGQRGWIAYRDGHCELAGWEAHGGSMEPMLVWGCKAELTRERTRQLKEFIERPDL